MYKKGNVKITYRPDMTITILMEAVTIYVN